LAGIYLHIPFCKRACHYCNFHFVTSLRQKDELIQALVTEIALQKDYLGGETIETIYFGGGTPSLLTITELQLLLETIRFNFFVMPTAEITLEANPDDISNEKLFESKEAGINRLSIGVQSFFDEDLQWMNRAHNAQQAISNLQLATHYFNNITIDLIYGTPQLTNEKWKKNVETALASHIPHFSCYALTVEPKTPLDKMIREHRSDDVNPDKQSEQFLLLMQWMEEAGYEHYEISNFAKPGFRSKHNAAYWQGKKYLGLGPSAHSFNGTERQWNVSNNNQYITAINKGELPAEKEVLTPVQQLNEYIMTSLRTMEGIDLEIINSRFGVTEAELLSKAKKHLESGLMKNVGNALVLTKEGKLLADGIAARLFF
jgi:oxygen-independent coproporphyrinogen-3 oxidase